MSFKSFLTGKTNETKQQLALEGGRLPATGHSVLMAPEDKKVYTKFTADYTTALKPDGMVEFQLAHRLAQDTWPSTKTNTPGLIPRH